MGYSWVHEANKEKQRVSHLQCWLHCLLLAQEQQGQAQHKKLYPAARQLSLTPVK